MHKVLGLFVEKLYQYVTTMVCLSYKGQPIIGVIHNPFHNLTFWAWVNKINSGNLIMKQKNVNQNDSKKIIISRSHAGEVKNVLLNALGEKTIVEEAGGAGKRQMMVKQ